MKTFEEHLEKLKDDVVAREPKNDKEDGFKKAVMIIYHLYKFKNNGKS